MKGKHIGKNAVKRKKTPLGCLLELGYSRKARRCSRLPLMSKLNALCAEHANPFLAKQGTGFEAPVLLSKKEKRPSNDGLFSLAAELGFEPRHTESESAVLPLHNSAKY